jgi:hypothetical protein
MINSRFAPANMKQQRWLHSLFRPACLLLFAWLLAACNQQFATPTPAVTAEVETAEATDTLPPIPTFTPSATPVPMQEFTDAAAGITLQLPADWQVSQPSQIALGTLYNLGPEPVGPGPYSSTFILIDTAMWDVEEAALELECGGDCQLPTPLEPAIVAGMPAQRTVIGSQGDSPLEWFFVSHAGRLVAFSLHHPETLQTLQPVVQSLALTAPTPTPSPTATPTETPTVTPTPTITATPSRTPIPTGTPRGGGPTQGVIEFFEVLGSDYDGQRPLNYLSESLRQEIPDGPTLVARLAIEPFFRSFDVAWTGTVGGQVNFDVTLHYAQGSVVRQVGMILENEEWLVGQIGGTASPQPPATPTHESEE